MTIQLTTRTARLYGRSKATLEAALNGPASPPPCFLDPSPFERSRGEFLASEVRQGERFPVVMDHPKRTRFAEVIRLPGGAFRVR